MPHQSVNAWRYHTSTLIEAGSRPITFLGLVIIPFEIGGIKLQVYTLTLDSKIPSVGLYYGKLALKHLQ